MLEVQILFLSATVALYVDSCRALLDQLGAEAPPVYKDIGQQTPVEPLVSRKGVKYQGDSLPFYVLNSKLCS